MNLSEVKRVYVGRKLIEAINQGNNTVFEPITGTIFLGSIANAELYSIAFYPDIALSTSPVIFENGTDYTIKDNKIFLQANLDKLSGANIFNVTGAARVENLTLEGLSGIQSLTFTGVSSIKSVTLPYSPTLRSLSITNCPRLTSLTVNTDTLDYYPLLSSVTMTTVTGLSTLQPNNVLDVIHKSLYFSLSSYSSSNVLNYSNFQANTYLTRTSASDVYIGKVYTHTTNNHPQIDPLYPAFVSPTEYISSTPECSSYTIFCPISSVSGKGVYTATTTRMSTDPVTWHRGLTAEFIKTGNVYNGRDVFSNVDNYHLLFNRSLGHWTVVGPTSSSETIWLSAQEGIGEWGNPPSLGWTGGAYTVAGWNIPPLTHGTVWFQATTVFPTSHLLYNARSFGREYGGAQLRVFYNPLSGYRPNFYKPDLDFSGIAHSGPISSPSQNGRGILVSPVHYVTNTHFKVGNPRFYNRDGTVEVRTILSSLDIGNDTTVGILNAPVSATFYQVGSGWQLKRLIGREDFKNYLYGPSQNGKVGYCLPTEKNPTASSWNGNTKYTLWHQVATIPKTDWHNEPLVGGDSSSPFWYVDGGKLILIGLTISAGPAGNYIGSRTSTVNQAMTALSARFGLPTHTLSSFSF